MKSLFENRNCLDGMPEYPDNYFDLAITDPPYFVGPNKPRYYEGKNNLAAGGKYKDIKSWEIPTEEYFNELKRVSKNQIIWGVNYFKYALIGGRIVWIKATKRGSFSQCEIAYQSFYKRIDLFEYLWNGFWQEDMKNKEVRIHPTHKPIALYIWMLNKYAKPGQKILDTHVGSASSLIACEKMDFEYVGYELDTDCFGAAGKRIDEYRSQQNLFREE